MKIKYKNKILEVNEKTTIRKLLEEEIKNSEHTVLSAKFNNEYVNLQYEIEKDGEIELIDVSTKEGMRVYRKTLIFILGKAFEKLYPEGKMTVDYQLNNSLFCDTDNIEITDEFIENLNKEMKEIVQKDLEIKQVIMTREEAKKLYDKTNTTKGRLQYDLTNNKKIPSTCAPASVICPPPP